MRQGGWWCMGTFLNGEKHTNTNTRLAPGDMITGDHVSPSAIRFFKDLPTEQDDVIERYFEPKPKEEDKPAAVATPGKGEAAPTTTEGKTAAPTATAGSSSSSSSSAESLLLDLLRHLRAAPHRAPWVYSEIPTADGALVRYAWEWYVQRRPRVRGTRRLTQGPEDRVKTVKEQEEVGGPVFNVRVGKLGKRNLKEDIERFKRAMEVARGRRGGRLLLKLDRSL